MKRGKNTNNKRYEEGGKNTNNKRYEEGEEHKQQTL
jgi:hypothetical protein